MTTGAQELDRKRWLALWWWFDLTQKKEKCEAALAWETTRRTKCYPALWRKFIEVTLPLMKHEGKPTRAGAYQRMHLIQRAAQAIPRPFCNYMMQGFDPSYTWLQLTHEQRAIAQGFMVSDREAIKVNDEYLLPRQSAKPHSPLSVGICEIDRDGSGELRIAKLIRGGQPLRYVAKTEFFQKLNLKTPEKYLFVYFDTRVGRDVLLDAWAEEMTRWLSLPSRNSGGEQELDYWKRSTAAKKSFGVSFDPQTGEPKEFWKPENCSCDIHAKPDEVHVIPSFDPGFAIFILPARYNLFSFRGAFHTRLKTTQFNRWHPKCVDYWKTLTIEFHQLPRNPDGSKRLEIGANGHPVREKVVRHLFNPAIHMPSGRKPMRSARRADLWLGLAANDVVNMGVSLGKSSAEGEFLLGHSRSYDALWNHQRSAAERLAELEKCVGRLDKNLAHWNDRTTELAAMGFFEAAAGDDEPLT